MVNRPPQQNKPQQRELRNDGKRNSFEIGDVTTDGGGGCERNRLAGDRSVEHVLQFVRGGGRAGAAGDFVQIVDAAVIEQSSLGIEDGNFGSDGSASLFDQRMRRIAKSRDRNGELAAASYYQADCLIRTMPENADPPVDGYGQARRCLEIILDALAQAGAGPEHVVRTRMFVTGAEHMEGIGRAHAEVFGESRPANTTVVVTAWVSTNPFPTVAATFSEMNAPRWGEVSTRVVPWPDPQVQGFIPVRAD